LIAIIAGRAKKVTSPLNCPLLTNSYACRINRGELAYLASGVLQMDRTARAILCLSFAFINFFFFSGTGIHVLGAVFLVWAIYLLTTKPTRTI